ncbi:hypothetical protein P152DRAFT_457183 [Eremomyces bilateralis CBS 781.70]|uniref:Uncharacterized protein n=1 Tax=Eremomyces bilateralis CBS 781.70 TaxID=1392243 RepID=A0A6G1G6Z0_9PEZI|nr:uncharacterized protein P152DRAFT_457183 [Eremomyces bilateralis CBS 781.70]KAF1813813.1 hypothetical protein P152DRAFT_457183 [Eremomyces bilateralis CBS 781.70]
MLLSLPGNPAHLLTVILCFYCTTAAARPGLSPQSQLDIADVKKRGLLEPPAHPVEKSILPAQICGIIGAYCVSVVVVGFLILVIGRPKRQRAMAGDPAPEIEMTKSPAQAFDPSPVSPTSTSRSWIKGKLNLTHSMKKSVTSLTSRGGSTAPNSRATSQPNSPGFASFDENIIQRDREDRQKEMDRLYAAVMEHDAKKASQSEIFAIEDEDEIQQTHPEDVPCNPQDKRILRVKTDAERLDIPGPHSPSSPRSPIRAIYPPDSEGPSGPRSPTSPIRAGAGFHQDHQHRQQAFLANPPTQTGPPPTSPKRNLLRRESRTSSMGSTASTSKTRKALRNLRISAPIRKEDGSEDERAPLSPRFYNPGPPPEPPSNPNTPHTSQTFASQGTMESPPLPSGIPQPQPQPQPQVEDYADEELDQPAPLPNPAPHRGPYMHSPDPAAPRPFNNSKSASTSSGALPLRAMGGDSFAPEATKTTYVERKRDRLMQGIPRTVRTPNTAGVPHTPYSPYMPFTPITPVTPHLVGQRERKEKKKWEKKVYGSPTAELVKSPAEIWDDGY